MDTIYALSSGSVPSGIAVIRMSGPSVGSLLERLCGALPEPRRATVRTLRSPSSGEVIDNGLVLWFPAPASFSGEDGGELHLHGGRAVVGAAFEALAAEGLRIAEPGEFTKRAFLNGKLDLTAAEGIADLVAAETEMQRRQALRQAGGELRRRSEDWRDELIALRAEIEARLDFADEGDVADALPHDFEDRIAALRAGLRAALASAAAGTRVREGFRVAILGRPNAGKSSLLNALSRRDVAIVTEEAGTTRDVLEVPLDLGGYPVLVYDTAGLRDSDSAAEREGVRRAKLAADAADLVLWLSDPAAGVEAPPDLAVPVWPLLTKADLRQDGDGGAAVISAHTGLGLEELEKRLLQAAADALGTGAAAVVRERQRLAIADALARLDELPGMPEDVAADLLRSAGDAIGRLSGRIGVELVLDRIFQDFCIGK
jgi:tRNA modification GTPase